MFQLFVPNQNFETNWAFFFIFWCSIMLYISSSGWHSSVNTDAKIHSLIINRLCFGEAFPFLITTEVKCACIALKKTWQSRKTIGIQQNIQFCARNKLDKK